MSYTIDGKILRVLKILYSKTRAFVSVNRKCSDFSLPCVCQTRYLSPLLFTNFINDFESFFRNNCNDLALLEKLVEGNLGEHQTQTF